ncbi:MAG: FAD-dependent oxidoreductase [Chloroflexi bacterium]|nr:FAD-dependent oxidoreductase [Chloroflexota bacterium]
MINSNPLQVAIIGAGPAGLFAAQTLATQGFGVALFNRDIKPGGLAEYGIFLDKHKIKDGLRAQFKQILALDKVIYFGNISLGLKNCVSIPELFDWGFSAVLVTCGAQDTKKLNLPGEQLAGVYNAKDLVFHYNHLPPYSLQDFPIGKKVAIVGAGNVMTDIAHYLIHYRNVEEITVIVRRGPAEVKFSKKELLPIIGYLDLVDFDSEILRISDRLKAIGQNKERGKEHILVALEVGCPREHNSRLLMRFLYSPIEVTQNPDGSVQGLILEENRLEDKQGAIIAQPIGKTVRMNFDTVIFAIGNRVTHDIGLPIQRDGILVAEKPKFPVGNISYEVGDPASGEPIPGIFVAGWSRNASTGLVGNARKDGVNASLAISAYLADKKPLKGVRLLDIHHYLASSQCGFTTKEDLEILETEEKRRAEIAGVEEYKFDSNKEMLDVINSK